MNKQSARNFGIGLTNILLEGAWPDKVQAAIVQARKALETGDEQELRDASYADDATRSCRAATREAARACRAAARGGDAPVSAAAVYAAVFAKRAVPDKAERIDAVLRFHTRAIK